MSRLARLLPLVSLAACTDLRTDDVIGETYPACDVQPGAADVVDDGTLVGSNQNSYVVGDARQVFFYGNYKLWRWAPTTGVAELADARSAGWPTNLVLTPDVVLRGADGLLNAIDRETGERTVVYDGLRGRDVLRVAPSFETIFIFRNDGALDALGLSSHTLSSVAAPGTFAVAEGAAGRREPIELTDVVTTADGFVHLDTEGHFTEVTASGERRDLGAPGSFRTGTLAVTSTELRWVDEGRGVMVADRDGASPHQLTPDDPWRHSYQRAFVDGDEVLIVTRNDVRLWGAGEPVVVIDDAIPERAPAALGGGYLTWTADGGADQRTSYCGLVRQQVSR